MYKHFVWRKGISRFQCHDHTRLHNGTIERGYGRGLCQLNTKTMAEASNTAIAFFEDTVHGLVEVLTCSTGAYRFQAFFGGIP